MKWPRVMVGCSVGCGATFRVLPCQLQTVEDRPIPDCRGAEEGGVASGPLEGGGRRYGLGILPNEVTGGR